VRFSSASFESVRSLVASDAGYSLLLQRPSPQATYAGPPLLHREIAEDVRTVDIVLAHARSARLTRRAQAFADFCRATFTAGPSDQPMPTASRG
jgi:DNA-binding transcriptional LysR family regulator